MKLDWDDLRDELDRSNLNVDISPISISGHPAVVVLVPVAPKRMCDSLRALVLAKDLELGSIAFAEDHLCLRHVILACGCSKDLVIATAQVLVQSAQKLAPAIRTRASGSLEAANIYSTQPFAMAD